MQDCKRFLTASIGNLKPNVTARLADYDSLGDQKHSERVQRPADLSHGVTVSGIGYADRRHRKSLATDKELGLEPQ